MACGNTKSDATLCLQFEVMTNFLHVYLWLLYEFVSKILYGQTTIVVSKDTQGAERKLSSDYMA